MTDGTDPAVSAGQIAEYRVKLRSGDDVLQLEGLRGLAAMAGQAPGDIVLEELVWLGTPARQAAALMLAARGDGSWTRVLLGDDLDLMRAAMTKHPLVVRALEDAIEDHDLAEARRAAAAEALGFLHLDEAVEPLTRALNDPSPRVRGAAVAALRHIGSEQTPWALIQTLLDGSAPARAAAAGLIGEFRALPLRGALLRTLGDDDGEVRRAAATALHALGESEWTEVVRGDADDFDRLGRHRSALALAPLARALGSDLDDIRRCAIAGLCQQDLPAVVSEMVRVIERRGWRARLGAAEVLGTLGVGPPRALEVLLGGLTDAAPEIRALATQALGALRDARALERLRRAARREEDVRVRAAAVLALRRFGERRPAADGATSREGMP